MKTSLSLLAVLSLAALAGCTGAPTTPQEAAADERGMAIANQSEAEQMDVDMDYDDPAIVNPNTDSLLETETPE